MNARPRHLTAYGCKYTGTSWGFSNIAPASRISGKSGEIPQTSLMINESSSLRQGQVQFCQFFGMDGAIFY
jgi:hypothetical protein